MQQPELVMKRSQSECLSFQPTVFSPSPVKKASRISSNIARELFDFPEEIQVKPRANTTPNLMSKSTPLKFDSDSSNEWSSSDCSSFMKECDSPTVSKNPFYQEHIFEEVSFELPSRSSNPIIRDVTFKHNNKKLFGFAINTIGRGECDTFNL